MAFHTNDRTLRVLVLLLLPLNLLSFTCRFLVRPNGREVSCIRPTIISTLLISLSAILALSDFDSSLPKRPIYELEKMMLQVNKLEFLLEEKTTFLNSKILEIDQSKLLIEEMDKKFEVLQKTLNDAKVSYSKFPASDAKVIDMKAEVQQLWEQSRRNNFNIYVLESKTLEVEKKVEEVASKVEQMQNIINEQWIQIQQLEQSLQMTKVMTSRVSNKVRAGCYKNKKLNGSQFSKLRRSFARHSHSTLPGLPDSFFLGGSISRFLLLETTNQAARILSTLQKKHHELQYKVKQGMEMNDYTAPLAHSEIIFVVASIIIMFPLMMVRVFCSSFVG